MNKIHLLILGLIILSGCNNEVVTKSERISGQYTSIGNFICENTTGNGSTWLKVCIDTKTKCEYLGNHSSSSSYILIEGTCKNGK